MQHIVQSTERSALDLANCIPHASKERCALRSTRRLIMSGLHSSRENHLLAALPAMEIERLFPQLEDVSLRTGDVLYEPGVELRHAYFPTTCIVSIVHAIENGSSAEVAIVGNEGIIGVPLFMGGDTAPSR